MKEQLKLPLPDPALHPALHPNEIWAKANRKKERRDLLVAGTIFLAAASATVIGSYEVSKNWEQVKSVFIKK